MGFDIPANRCLAVEYTIDRLALNIRRQFSKKTRDLELGRKLLVTKYKGWSYEDEVRSIVQLDTPEAASGLFFAEFGNELRLKEVIVGVRSTLSRRQVVAAISGQDKSVKMVKARLAFKTFRVVRQRNQKLWL